MSENNNRHLYLCYKQRLTLYLNVIARLNRLVSVGITEPLYVNIILSSEATISTKIILVTYRPQQNNRLGNNCWQHTHNEFLFIFVIRFSIFVFLSIYFQCVRESISIILSI